MRKDIIKTHCGKIDKLFEKTLENDPIEAALLLGNCLLLEKNAEGFSLKNIQESLNRAKKALSPIHINKIWQSIEFKLKDKAKLLDKKTSKSLQKVRLWFITTTDILRDLQKPLLVAYGQQIKHHRLALICIIRQHLLNQKIKDPFCEGFSYELLMQGSVEQNYLYLSKYIKECKELPSNDIVALGFNSSHIALLLLKDLISHPQFFEISSEFAKVHPAIRKEIAAMWQTCFENYPLLLSEKEELKPLLIECQQSFPEFAEVATNTRISRDISTVDIPQGNNYLDYVLCGVAIPSLLIRGPKAITHAASIYALGAALWNGAGIGAAAASVCTTAIPVAFPIVSIGTLAWLSRKYNN